MQWEVILEGLTGGLLHEGLPHLAARSVIREGEVNGTVEELLKVFLRPVVRLTGTPDDGDECLIIDPPFLPLVERLLNAVRISHVVLFGFFTLLALLFLGGPDTFTLVNVDDARLVSFCGLHDHSDHLFCLGLASCIFA